MSPDRRPEAVPFDPGSAEIPPTLGPGLTDPETQILLLVAPDPGDLSAGTAIALAEARGRGGALTILADGAVAEPGLHERLGLGNLEGLADVFLFGASLRHVRVRPADRHFDFVSTGAFVPDPAAVLTSDRWDGIAAELGHEGAMLLLYVPLGTPGLPPLSRRIGRALVIGGEQAVHRAVSRLDSACEIVGAVDPGAAPAPPPGMAAAAAAEAGEAVPAERELREPPLLRADEERRRTVSPFLVVLLLIVLALAGWFLYREYLAEPEPEPVSESPVSQTPSPAPQPEPVAVETPIPVSVAVEAHQDLTTAEERVAQLEQAEPDVHFFLAPLSVGGDLYYRLLAGPVADREAGTVLMQRLVDDGHKTAVDSWAVLPTHLAFRLGEFATPEDARIHMDSLRAHEIPTYIVPVRYQDGATRYRVYGGAYTSAAEAEPMRKMLESAGVRGGLVERTGEPAGGA